MGACGREKNGFWSCGPLKREENRRSRLIRAMPQTRLEKVLRLMESVFDYLGTDATADLELKKLKTKMSKMELVEFGEKWKQ